MKTKREKKIERMIAKVDAVIARARDLEADYADALEKVHPAYRKSARNLIHYRALRRHDLRKLQKQLGALGLSRLGKTESHVMASLLMTRSILQRFVKAKKLKLKKANLTFKQGPRLTNTNTKALLGYRSKGRRVRIMVTIPGEAADDGTLVHRLLASGMNSARVNCAHDGPDAWKKMVAHIQAAREKVRKNCKICMDLGGPKIRTGRLAPGPSVIHIRPERDVFGQILHPALLWLGPPDATPPEEADACLSVPEAWLAQVKKGDCVWFEDTREKKRTLKIVDEDAVGRWAACRKGAYVQTGTLLYIMDKDTEEKPPDGVPVGDLPSKEQAIVLRPGDALILHKDPRPGEPARYDPQGYLLAPAHISVTAPDVFAQVRPGERVLFDDGKLGGVIREISPDELYVEITQAKAGSAKLRADKGINFPDSALQIQGLTPKDREDLAFVAEHADVVNMSFVNTPEDVEDLLAEIDRLGASGRLGIILKIETKRGFANLTEILLTAMRTYPIGVMIARGDLAIECGWEKMARIQEEIMSICEAAHVPDIWATQVLENLAKKGLPSRAEITDAATAQRAECVMLNKGPHILSALSLLHTILRQAEAYQDKKAPMLPALEAETVEEA